MYKTANVFTYSVHNRIVSFQFLNITRPPEQQTNWASVCFCTVTLLVYSAMCLFFILAGNWVLLICVWGLQLPLHHCPYAHKYTLWAQHLPKSLLLNWLVSFLSETTDRLINWTGHTSCHITWSHHSQLSKQCFGDKSHRNKMVYQLSSKLWILRGDMLMKVSQISHGRDCSINQIQAFISLFFKRPDVLSALTCLSVSSFEWPALPLFKSQSLFNFLSAKW